MTTKERWMLEEEESIIRQTLNFHCRGNWVCRVYKYQDFREVFYRFVLGNKLHCVNTQQEVENVVENYYRDSF